MNQVLIKNWNNTVKKEDRIFVLGDFCLSGKDKIIEIGRQLNGRKTLILGNHDSASIKTYYEAGFEAVSKYPIIIEDFFILSHEPKFVLDLGIYYNIYGHLHNHKEILDFTSKTACISVERTNYKPISFEKVKNEMISKYKIQNKII